MKYNFQAEANILGAIENNNDLICDAMDILNVDDFYNTKHQIIYGIMKDMYEKGKVIDITTLAESLGKKLDEVGGITYLSQLAASTLSTDIKQYCEIVREKSELRKLSQNLSIALEKIKNNDPSEEVIDFLQQQTLNLKISNNEEDGNVTKALEEFLKDLEVRYKNGGDIQGIKTHLKKLDSVIGGLYNQQLIIVAARPSMGKSVLATNLAQNVALKSNKKVALFSLEMNNVSLVKRMVSNLAMIDSYDLRDGNISDKQWEEVAKATGVLDTKNLKLFEQTMSLNKICRKCKKLKVQNGLDIAIVDYLQLIDDAKKSSNRTEEVSYISRRLKLLAKELNITVIALSQLSRAPEARKDHRPMLSDLRESGSIEQDADVVIFLYRDEYYHKNSEDKNIVELIIAKQRDGKLGGIKCAWIPQYQLIGNLDFEHQGSYDPEVFKKKEEKPQGEQEVMKIG